MKLSRVHFRWVIGVSIGVLLAAGLGVIALQAVRLRQFGKLASSHGGHVEWAPHDEIPGQFRSLVPVPFLQSPGAIWMEQATSDDLRKFSHALQRGYGLTDQLDTLYFQNSSFTGEGFATLPALPKLNVLSLERTRVDAGLLRQLDRFPSLAWLSLSECPVDSGLLAALPVLPNLEVLFLNGTRVDAAGLKQLARQPKLSDLVLSDTSVGNEEIAALVGCRKLRELQLDSTFIDDGAVEYLLQFPRLNWLSVSNTGISDEGLGRLAVKFPDLEVWDD